MVNAPPTPPPTSPRELLDEARNNAMEAVVVTDPSTAHQLHSQPRPELYATVISTLKVAIANRDYQQALNVAEHFNLNMSVDRSAARLLIVAPLVLGYLIEDNLQPARFVISKLPESLQALPVTHSLSDLLHYAIHRDHAKVYNQSAELANAVSKPDFPDKDLADLVTGLLPGFTNAFRDRTFQLLSKAYTSLSLPLASIYLGLPAEQLVTVAQNNGWSYDPSTQTFQPRVVQQGTARLVPSSAYTVSVEVTATLSKESTGSSTLTTFELVAESVAQLEA